MRHPLHILLISFFTVCFQYISSATTRYVRTVATGTGDGSSRVRDCTSSFHYGRHSYQWLDFGGMFFFYSFMWSGMMLNTIHVFDKPFFKNKN